MCMAQRWDNYQPENKNVILTDTNLPIVIVNTDNQMIQKSYYILCRMTIIDNQGNGLNHLDTINHPNQRIDYKGNIAIRYRGSSSFSMSDKKPYTFRTLGSGTTLPQDGGVKDKAPLLGMAADSKWALIAPYADKSMMRDVLAFSLSQPWMDFTPHARFCELVLDNVYYGVYVLSETVSQGNGRLNLPDPGLEGDMLTGGYIVEVDRTDEQVFTSYYHPVDNNGWEYSWYNINFSYQFPDYEDMVSIQRQYIRQQVRNTEDAINTGKKSEYEQVIDVRSFVDYQLAKEFGHDVDGYRLSGKFYKNRDSHDKRFKMAVWDMNLAYGNADYYDGWRTDTWIYQGNPTLNAAYDSQMVPFWWYKLNQDTAYSKMVKSRWAEYRQNNFSEIRIMGLVDSLANELTVNNAEERNSRAWNRWGRYVWPNYFVASNFYEEVDFLKGWIHNRLLWMDEQLDYDPTQTALVTGETEKHIIGYYAIDGRLIGDGNTPVESVTGHGVIIVRYSDFSTKRLLK